MPSSEQLMKRADVQRKSSKNEWRIAGVILVAGLAWYGYKMYEIGTPEYKQELNAKLTAEADQNDKRERLAQQQKELALEIHRLMQESLQRCIDKRDAEAPKVGGNLALARYAECLQAHKRQFGIE